VNIGRQNTLADPQFSPGGAGPPIPHHIVTAPSAKMKTNSLVRRRTSWAGANPAGAPSQIPILRRDGDARRPEGRPPRVLRGAPRRARRPARYGGEPLPVWPARWPARPGAERLALRPRLAARWRVTNPQVRYARPPPSLTVSAVSSTSPAITSIQLEPIFRRASPIKN